jgi:cytochrome c oxidase subunit II
MRLTPKRHEVPASEGRARGPEALVARLVMLLMVPLLVAGCGDADHYPMSTVHPHSDFAEIIHSLYVSIFWWTMLILAIVWVLVAVVVVRFRRRSEDDQPKQIRGHLGLEIGWTVGPALIVVAITIPTIQAVFETQRPVADDALLVEVTGHQFWWEFHYPEQGVTTANELWLPVDRAVSLRLESNDVIHSFWVPLLGGKRDVNPEPAVREGREPGANWLHFTPQETGVYRGQCAEFCGESHALMSMRVVVDTESGFDDWVDRWHASAGAAVPADVPDPVDGDGEAAENGVVEIATAENGGTSPAAYGVQTAAGQDPQATAEEAPQVTLGRELFLNSTCIACHGVQGTSAQGAIAPNLTLFGERHTVGAGILENTEENLVRWIMTPHLIKPGVQMPGVDTPGGNWPATGFSEEEVRAIAAYLLSLR